MLTHYLGDPHRHQLRRRFEPPFAIELSPMKHLVGIDAMPASDNSNRCSWLECLFHYLAPFLLGAMSPSCGRFDNYDFCASGSSHSSSITGVPWRRKTVLTERLLSSMAYSPDTTRSCWTETPKHLQLDGRRRWKAAFSAHGAHVFQNPGRPTVLRFPQLGNRSGKHPDSIAQRVSSTPHAAVA